MLCVFYFYVEFIANLQFAFVVTSGCDCNFDLCSSQRNADYGKWKWFDYCLYKAIEALSFREKGSFPVYSGLNAVKMDKKMIGMDIL